MPQTNEIVPRAGQDPARRLEPEGLPGRHADSRAPAPGTVGTPPRALVAVPVDRSDPAVKAPPARILIIDDTPAIHEDFRKILVGDENHPLDTTEAALFGEASSPTPRPHFLVDSAHQGQEGLALAQQAVAEGRPYALAFVDIRMPPGWDGIETIAQLWAADPDLQVVVATAYSDYSWSDIVRRFGTKDNLLILKKPFDNVEVLQLAQALTTKWQLGNQSRLRMQDLDRMVADRTGQLNEAATHILRLNRLYSVLSKSNELVGRTRSLPHLCEQACRIAVEDGLFRLAWVGLLDARTLDIKPFAHWGCTTGYLSRVRVSADESQPEGLGPAGVAVREGRYDICNAAPEDPRLAPWREAIRHFGFQSIGAFPLRVQDRTLGVLVLYSSEPGFFNGGEIQLLDQLSNDLSFAIELVEQDQQLHLQRAALESAANSIVITDPEGLIVWHNAAFTRLTGYSAAETKGKKTSVLKSATHGPEFYRKMWQTIASGRVWQGEIVNRRKDGSLYTEEMTITPVHGEKGVITHYIAIKQDITERKRTEQRVAAFSTLGQRLSAAQTVKESAQIIVEVADQLLGWDACACDLYSEAEDKAFPVLRMEVKDGRRIEGQTPDGPQSLTPVARRAVQEGGVLLLREKAERMPGDKVFLGGANPASASLLFVPIRNVGKVSGVLSIQSYTPGAYDQASLETLQALADHCGGALDRIKTEEALHFTQEELRQSQKLEAIGQLAGGVAHDFNNLLAVIRGNIELALMRAGEPGPETTECMNQAVAAADRAANLTRQLLAFGRKQVMQAQSLDLNELVGNLTKMLKRIIGEHIQLQCSYAAGLACVKADPGMIEQVLINLVINARDAMARGGELLISTHEVTFEAGARAHPEARPGRFVALTVRDTGTGIAPEHLPHIFEPFFTTKEVGKGTGLGLATAYGIIKQHGGWIEAASEGGAGSTFAFYLPALESGVKLSKVPLDDSSPLCGNETILLVEDEDSVRVLTRRVLETFGYRVREAASGREALDLPASSLAEIDLLLTDVIMPGGITGRELADRLTSRRPELKVIFTSGYSGEALGHDTEILRATKRRFLPKPCSPRDLLLALRQSLDER